MLFAILCIITFLIQNLCCKEYGRRFPESIAMQSAMTAVSTLVIALIMLPISGLRLLQAGEWGIAIAFGFWFVVTLASMTLAMNYGHMGITLLIQNSSLIVPTLYSMLVWRERLTAIKAVGIACVLAMLALSSKGSGESADEAIRRRWNRRLWILFTLLAFTGDSLLSILQGSMAKSDTSPATFTLWTSLCSTAFAAILFAVASRRNRAALPYLRRHARAFWLSCAAIGLSTAGGNCFSILALARLPGTVLYPLRQGALVLLMWVLGVLLYREKANRSGWLMLVLGLAGLVLLSI